MSSNPEMPTEQPASSHMTINSPTKQTASDLPPLKRSQASQRTERPVEPPNAFLPYTRKEEEAPIGNPKAIALLKLEGQLGIFYDRDKTTRLPVPIEVNFDNIRNAAYRVLGTILRDRIRSQRQLDANSIDLLTQDVASNLANGVSVMTYMKLRIVNYHDNVLSDRYRTRPKVPQPFEVPQPYALAISQLGQIKLSGMVEEHYYTPTAPAGFDITYGCPQENPWSTAAYVRAVAVAKDLGIRFSSVDLNVKMGSSWWLYRQTSDADGDNFRLECPYPEENFTENSAILAMLFASNENDGRFDNPIIQQNSLGTDTYGTMLRNPFNHIAVNVFDAISEEQKLNFRVCI